ncbi:chaplin [Kitasatospora sp. NPDC057595]|uniref:chaplin n=1 Tax=Kitasatospora sp. NPDC057595 TaxID=3346177 RepID=UPI0036A998D9
MQNVKKAAVLSAAAAGLVLGAAGGAAASAGAEGVAAGSPGVVSGNQIQIPVHVPLNVCGNSINLIGLLNPAFGNSCANVEAPPQHEHEHAEDDC